MLSRASSKNPLGQLKNFTPEIPPMDMQQNKEPKFRSSEILRRNVQMLNQNLKQDNQKSGLKVTIPKAFVNSPKEDEAVDVLPVVS